MRCSAERGLVARLSQGMSFVMDVGAQAFVELHACSRLVDPAEARQLAQRTIVCANDLAGEAFDPATPLTRLSGGQSRALMIADAALVGSAPIVLVDEIENAGVDRWKALELLCGSDKIVFVVTHDPLIALAGTRRLVIGGGAIRTVIEPSSRERANAQVIHGFDAVLTNLRERLRTGERIEDDLRAVCTAAIAPPDRPSLPPGFPIAPSNLNA